MLTKKKTLREPFIFQLLFDSIGPDDTNDLDVTEMSNKEFLLFLVFISAAIFVLNYLVIELTT